MKKVLLAVVAVMFATCAFAQDWSVGGRVGSGFQAVGQYGYSADKQIEARFGASWANHGGGVTADFTVLHNWKVCTMDWTPSAGEWFFDAGVGINVGGREHYAYVGAAGMARLGITFNDAPVSLSLDYTPVIGPEIGYYKGNSAADFRAMGFANVGITCTYNF
ncbi:MAG: hypothetical protein IJX40_01890 [Alistipes sp.]|nr:hypothetical protein [Alistipes sp.]